MSIYTSKMRYVGSSGVDVESMVTQLMKAESGKYEKTKQSRQVLAWKQESYHGVIDNLSKFQATYLDMMNTETNMRSKAMYGGYNVTAKSKGENVDTVRITTTTDTLPGTYKMEVSQIAEKHSFSSANALGSAIVSKHVDFSRLTPGDSIKMALDGGLSKTHVFTADEVTKLSTTTDDQSKSLVLQNVFKVFGSEKTSNMVQDPAFPDDPTKLIAETVPKVQASYKDGIITITPYSGHELILTSGNQREQSVKGEYLKNPSSINGEFSLNIGDKTEVIQIDTDFGDSPNEIANKINKSLGDKNLGDKVMVTAESKNGVDYSFKVTALNTSSDITVTAKDNTLASLGLQDSFVLKRTNPLGDFGFENGQSNKVDLSKPLSEAYENVSPGETGQFIVNGKTIAYNTDAPINKLIEAVNKSDAGVVMSYDKDNDKIVLASQDTGVENSIDFSGSGGIENTVLGKMGLAEASKAKDLEAVIDGQKFVRSSNNFEAYGFKFAINGVTEKDHPITIVSEKDSKNAMDNIKKFIADYNKLLVDLNSVYDTSRPKRSGYDYYEPLTEDQKAVMSEVDIKNWEDQGKKGLLYRDTIVEDIAKSMRNFVYENVPLENGQKISLYEIGITTSSNYKDNGKLIINEEKLEKALETRGNEVAVLFTKASSISLTEKGKYNDRLKEEGITERLNDIISKAVNTSGGSLTKVAGVKDLSINNDIYVQLQKMDKTMEDLYRGLIKKEEYYYEKFTRMEEVVTNANNQMASLQSFMPGAM